MTTDPRPRGRLLTRGQLIAVIAAVLAAVVPVVLLAGLLPTALRDSAPDRPVRAYLEAIESGDITTALKLGRIAPAPGDKLLTDAAYRQASYQVSAFAVLGTSLNGSSGTVRVSISQGGSDYAASFQVRREPGVPGLSPWRLVPQQLPEITIAFPVPLELPITVGGTKLTPEKGVVTQHVFPGSYRASAAGSRDIRVTDATADATFATQRARTAVLALGLASDGGAQAESQVASWLSACAASSALHPDGCPFQAVPDPTISYSNGRWTIQSRPGLSLGEWNPELGGWPVTTTTPGYITFTADAARGDLIGTATTGSRPFVVVGTAVPDASGEIRFVPSPSYASSGASALT